MDADSVESSRLRSFLASGLEPLRACVRGGELDLRGCEHRCQDLFMFVCGAGHPCNLYSSTGIPRTHAAWEMQLIVDDGLLFFLYATSWAALGSGSVDDAAFTARLVALCEALCLEQAERMRQRARAFYAENIVSFVTHSRAGRGPSGLARAARVYFDRVVIEAYLRVAIRAPRATLTLDLFPANTGADNITQGLKGIVSRNGSRDGSPGARSFWSIRAESYTRYYGFNLAKKLEPRALRFALVVPYANGVRHIAMTRCWPIDGAENIARYIKLAQALWRALEAARGGETPACEHPRILVSGYSQGGAAVRLFHDALRGVEVSKRNYFRQSIPRGYASRSRTLDALAVGDEATRWPLVVHTVSVATMGGIDGVGFAERYPQLRTLAGDQRGAAGVHGCTNRCGGLHLALCHDHDPARWIVPGPLVHGHRRLRRGERRKLNLVRILLKFGGPAKALHGGVWMAGTERAFAHNLDALALLAEIRAKLISNHFVDEADYLDPRCTRDAFPHLVVGTLGYPGWAIVAKFAQALAALEQIGERRGGEPVELVRESSWCCDILPEDHVYEQVVGRARTFHASLHRRAQTLIARLEAEAAPPELLEVLRQRFAAPPARRHLLGPGASTRP